MKRCAAGKRLSGASSITCGETCVGGWGGGACGALNSNDSCFGLVLFLRERGEDTIRRKVSARRPANNAPGVFISGKADGALYLASGAACC